MRLDIESTQPIYFRKFQCHTTSRQCAFLTVG